MKTKIYDGKSLEVLKIQEYSETSTFQTEIKEH